MMGLFYWQLNDVWLGVLWLSIDYYGCWKVLNFYVWCFYVLFVISVECKDGVMCVSLIFDVIMLIVVCWWVWMIDVDGKVLVMCDEVVIFVLLFVMMVVMLFDMVLFGVSDLVWMIVVVELLVDGCVVLCMFVLQVLVKVMVFFDLGIVVCWDGDWLMLIVVRFVCVVWVGFGVYDVMLLDNVFDLLLGESVMFIVQFRMLFVMLKCVFVICMFVGLIKE